MRYMFYETTYTLQYVQMYTIRIEFNTPYAVFILVWYNSIYTAYTVCLKEDYGYTDVIILLGNQCLTTRKIMGGTYDILHF